MLNILLVDDEAVMKAAFQKIIPWEAEGFHIIGTASNGAEALELVASLPVDIVITDLKMPQMDGLTLIARLKAASFDGSILVLSNYSDFDLVREALLAGAQDYLLKVNINAKSLLAKLRDVQEVLSSQRRDRRHAQIINEQGDLLRANALRVYFSGDEGERAHTLLEAYEEGCAPFCMFTIDLFAAKRRSGIAPPSLLRVADLVKSSFQEVNDVLLFVREEGGITCVVPMALLIKHQTELRYKCEQIMRQITLYFNVSVLVLHCPPCISLHALRAQHQCCMNAGALAFYALESMLLSSETLLYAQPPPDVQAEELARMLAEAYPQRTQEEVTLLLEKQLDIFRERRVRPEDAKHYFAHMLAQLRLWCFHDDGPRSVEEDTNALHNSQNELQLMETLQTSASQLLRCILPPAYAHCKVEVKKTLLYLHTHYDRFITLDDIAQEVKLDRSYICRLFKRETGSSIFVYLNKLKMEAAAALMRGGKVLVREIAADIGIQDPFYFTRLFKKHFGMNPSEYMKDVCESAK